MPSTRHFLPWYSAGYATALKPRPDPGAARATIEVSFRVDAHSGRRAFQLEGPGDVARRDVLGGFRTEPYDGCVTFEPSYFPYVELAEVDMPWRYSPFGVETITVDPAQSARRRLPWIALVVVEVARSKLESDGPLPILTTPANQLPNAEEVWAWAHVQVLVDDGKTLQDSAARPASRVARLLCPRRLASNTEYRACVVPAFRIGRAAGLKAVGRTDEAVGEHPLAPAWNHLSEKDVSLPTYLCWSFATRTGGSFETLARAITPRSAPPSASGRVIDIATPGWGVDPVSGAKVTMQGALRPTGPELPTSQNHGAEVVAQGIARAVGRTSGDASIDVRPPAYGQHFVADSAFVNPADPGWFHQVNTDPRWRMAAGLGAWAVTVEQEQLVERAWRELPLELMRDPSGADRVMAAAVSASLFARHARTTTVVASAALARMIRASGPLAPVGLASLVTLPTMTSGVGAPAVEPGQAAHDAAPPGTGNQGMIIRLAQPTAEAGHAPTPSGPAYTLLRAVSPEWLLPGAGDIPMDSVVVFGTNPEFVESFMLGVNHALSAELLWRRYPLKAKATLVASFWDGEGDDIQPVADWPEDTALGQHQTGGTVGSQLVLLIRGGLLASFPTAGISLQRRSGNAPQRLLPGVAGRIDASTAFFGFPLSITDARAAEPPWEVVISEDASHVRFGADDPPHNGTSATQLQSWQDLDWGHPHLADQRHIPVQSPEHAPAGSTLVGRNLPAGANPNQTATWARDAGHLAVALSQPAFELTVPLTLWLGLGSD